LSDSFSFLSGPMMKTARHVSGRPSLSCTNSKEAVLHDRILCRGGHGGRGLAAGRRLDSAAGRACRRHMETAAAPACSAVQPRSTYLDVGVQHAILDGHLARGVGDDGEVNLQRQEVNVRYWCKHEACFAGGTRMGVCTGMQAAARARALGTYGDVVLAAGQGDSGVRVCSYQHCRQPSIGHRIHVLNVRTPTSQQQKFSKASARSPVGDDVLQPLLVGLDGVARQRRQLHALQHEGRSVSRAWPAKRRCHVGLRTCCCGLGACA
jgi:hypothetical protein